MADREILFYISLFSFLFFFSFCFWGGGGAPRFVTGKVHIVIYTKYLNNNKIADTVYLKVCNASNGKYNYRCRVLQVLGQMLAFHESHLHFFNFSDQRVHCCIFINATLVK